LYRRPDEALPDESAVRPAGQRRALGALFLVLALALAGVAAAAADAARHQTGLVVIALAAGALALWLGLLAFRALGKPPS
jgi:protein-S-isoprenylcysteine O-methyltransferase Ste14